MLWIAGHRVLRRDVMPRSELFKRVWSDDVDGVGMAVRFRPDRLRRREFGQTLLHCAQSPAMVDLLVGRGLPVDAREVGNRGFTPLHRAAQDLRVPVADALLRHGADPDARGMSGWTPLIMLAEWSSHRDEDQAEVDRFGALLLDAGAEPAAVSDTGWTALHGAARFGRMALLQRLVAAGADPRHRDDGGSNALHMCGHRPAVAAWLRDWAHQYHFGWKPDISPEQVTNASHRRLRIAPTRRRAVTVVYPYTLVGWSLAASPTIEWISTGEGSSIRAVDLSHDATTLLVAWEHGPVELRRWHDPDRGEMLLPEGVARGAARFNPTQPLALVTAPMEEVLVIDVDSHRQLAVVDAGERTHSIAFSTDGRRIAVAKSYQGGTAIDIHTLDGTGRPHHDLEIERMHVDTQASLAFSPGGEFLAAWETSATGYDRRGWRGDIVVFPVADGAVVWEVTIGQALTGDPRPLRDTAFAMGYFTDVAYTHTGTVAIAVDGSLFQFDADNGLLLHRTPVADPVSSIARDDRTLWLASSGGLTSTTIRPT
jgi:hypothetical protein